MQIAHVVVFPLAARERRILVEEGVITGDDLILIGRKARLLQSILIKADVFLQSFARLEEGREHDRMALFTGRDERLLAERGGHKDRRRRTLQRPRQNRHVVRLVESSLIREIGLAPGPFDNIEAFVETLTALVHRLVEAVVRRLDKAAADAKIEPPAAD